MKSILFLLLLLLPAHWMAAQTTKLTKRVSSQPDSVIGVLTFNKDGAQDIVYNKMNLTARPVATVPKQATAKTVKTNSNAQAVINPPVRKNRADSPRLSPPPLLSN